MATKKLPGVLSFNRRLDVGDAVMENLFSSGQVTPVDVVEHGMRGTQNAAGGSANVSNIQVTQSAKLSPDADAGMRVRFPLLVLPLKDALNACAPAKGDKPEDIVEFRQEIRSFLDRLADGPSVEEVSNRIARNVLNGRWLWRNRLKAASVSVKVLLAGEVVAEAEAFDLSINDFDNLTGAEKELGLLIAKGLSGEAPVAFDVEAVVNFGVTGAIEVHCSEQFVPNKPTGRARLLYSVNRHRADTLTGVVGTAAIRDAKVGNALRTVDTWYPAFTDLGKPIPVEPNGANLSENLFFRDGAASGYKLLPMLTDLEPGSADEMFVLGCLIRGGVFSGKKES